MKSALSLVEALDAALPQTQCTRCGYPDCHAYASAIAAGSADIDRCPPGGTDGIARLAALTGRAVRPLDPTHGHEGPRQLAVIDEAGCIGCTLCLQACPVDSIVGGPKAMHTVINDLCTGCELCIPVCPVDCIALVAVTGSRTGWQAWSAPQAAVSRERYALHRMRIERDAREQTERMTAGPHGADPEARTTTGDRTSSGAPLASVASGEALDAAQRRKSVIDAALARAREARLRR